MGAIGSYDLAMNPGFLFGKLRLRRCIPLMDEIKHKSNPVLIVHFKQLECIF